MDYDISDSSGTDDDLPPPHQNRFARISRVGGNGRSSVAAPPPYQRMQTNDMETQIHIIEQEAYFSVLRAFKAQSDALTWEKESLITELRKELRVSDEEHRDLLSRVNNDNMIKRIRDWRKGNESQQGVLGSFQPVHDSVASPTVSASRKKQKTGQSVSALSVGAGAPSPTLHAPMQPSSSNLNRNAPPGARGKKTKTSLPYPSALPGRQQINSRSTSGTVGANEIVDPYKVIGKRVWTRWPEDNNFYEATVLNYKEGRHALVYDINTQNEAWEWVDLKEISPEDIKWDEDPALSYKGSLTGQGRGFKKSSARGGAVGVAGRGRGTLKGQPKKDINLPQNGIGRKGLSDIELLHTDTLIKEVEKVFSADHPDPVEVEKAKKVLKEHEQALVQAIATLQDASDGESVLYCPLSGTWIIGIMYFIVLYLTIRWGRPSFLQGQSMDRDQGWKKWQSDKMGEVPNGIKGARVASEKKQEAQPV